MEYLPTLPNLLKALGKSDRKKWRDNEKRTAKKIAYSGGPKGHRYMHYILKKGPISMYRRNRFLSQSSKAKKKFKMAPKIAAHIAD